MNASELMRRVLASGADESGIRDRFMDDDALYAQCFLEFLEEPNFALLREAMEQGDYDQAFAAAHALKCLSGNLGVTGFYEAVCVLVESLRAKDYGPTEQEHRAVLHQLYRLRSLAELPVPTEDGQAEENALPAAPPDPAPAEIPAVETKRVRNRFLPAAIALLAAVVLCVAGAFTGIFLTYRRNIAAESADHLTEIAHQVRVYIEEKIANDWRTARSVGDTLQDGNYTDDDATILDMMKKKQQVWQVTDIRLYTEDGGSICVDGLKEPNDVASDTVVRARETGEYLSIVDSNITYTVPVDTALRYHGSRIAAVSVVQSMDSYLDELGFSTFDGRAWMYLTEASGIVVSSLSSPGAPSAFNIQAVLAERTLAPLTGSGVFNGDLLAVPEMEVFRTSGGGPMLYLVSSPVDSGKDSLKLYYLAPVDAVNETMNRFARQLVLLSLFLLLVFAAVATLLFVSVYQSRKKRFDQALLAREQMFDLLTEHTKAVYTLFEVGQPAPRYISNNAAAILGGSIWTMHRTAEGLRMHSRRPEEHDTVLQINGMMADWDGRGPFKSGYILNDHTVPPSYFEVQLYPADDEGRDYVGIAQDVTQAFRREQAARDALVMAERANEAKSRFLSNMSHDIRTPMNAIVNMTEFSLDSMDQPKKQREYLLTIRESADHLLRIINDVLDMSRIESGQTVIESVPFSMQAELQRQADIIRPLCANKELTLITDFQAVHTPAVRGDQLKLGQILMNLLSNAVKFTPPKGAVRFTAAEVPSLREDMVDLRVTVEDTGIGIPQDYIQRIFEPFSRADDKRVSRIEGTGLGLSICHSYVTAMGGVIHCESEEGEGSVFTVELFFQKTDALPEETAVHSAPGGQPFLGKRCLVGEDNRLNQTIAATMLERLGFLVDMASDGRETVQRFLQSRPGLYDVVYMDIQMPVMDGYQATVAIRESEHPQARTIPILAMTANVFAEDVEKARIAGMDGHLGKPMTTLRLVEETERAMQKKKRSSPS